MDYEILSPWAEVDPGEPRALVPRATDLQGKTIGFYTDWKWHGPVIMQELEKLLKERLPGSKFSHFQFPVMGMDILQNENYKAKLVEWVKTVDTVIVGFGDTRSGSLYLACDSVTIEDLGKPVIMLSKKGFERDAMLKAEVKNLPGLRITTATIPSNAKSLEPIQEGLTKEVIDNLILGLTGSLTAEEKTPTRKAVQIPPRIAFKGTLEEVNRFFYKTGWSDGLPLIPPTEEAVKEMLQGTDLPADHIVAKLPPRYGHATVEKIAINAVMAGALPTYLPLLIANVQALVSHPENRHVLVQPVSVAPCWVINGPIRNDINVNSGSLLFSSGMMANAVIGRAMQLIIKNIGGVQPGIDLVYFYGHAGMSSLCFGENEEASPFDPLHVENGLKKEDSAVSLFFVSANSQVFSGGGSFADDKLLVSALSESVSGALGGKGIGVGGIGGTNCLFIISPGSARLLANNGWTKQKVYSFIKEEARNVVRSKRIEKWEPTWGEPEKGLRIMVAGGLINYNTAYQFQGGFLGWITQKVELPAKWPELVKKYQDTLPPYAQYLKVK